jgi:hypothetical protein
MDFPRTDNELTNSRILARTNLPEGVVHKTRSRLNWAWRPDGKRRKCECLTIEAYAIRLLEEGRGREAEEILDMFTR